jgi:ankyrin repeat protein
MPYKHRQHSLELLNKKDRDGNTILHLSVLDGCIELVEYLLDKGVNVNDKNNDGDTPLHLAIKLNDFDITKLLLDNHAQIDVVNKKNETPVDLATVRIFHFIFYLEGNEESL